MAFPIVPDLEKQVNLDATVGNANYTQAFDSSALSPTSLGEFGSKLAITAATNLAQKRGLESGLNPKGTLIPPLTTADKAFQDGYIAQSQNVLGVQAQKLMHDGQSELTKAWKLTPELIASYSKNMQEGLRDIISNAPMQAQPGLAAQFKSNLENSRSQYNNKMILQQKEESQNQASLFNNSQLVSIYESARNGDFETSQKLTDEMIARNKSMRESGMITSLQEEANAKASRMSHYSGMYTGAALKAFENKTSDEFLSTLLDNKPDDISVPEWEAIAKNVMGEIQLQESFQHRNENSLYSEGNRLMAEGLLSSDFIARLESETTDRARFNNFMGQVASYQRKNFKTNQEVVGILPYWTDPDSMAVASNKTKNMALVQAGQDVQQRAANLGRTIDEFQGQAEAMSTAGAPVESFTKKMNAGFLSGNPNLMMRNLGAYNALINSNPKALDGMSDKAKAMMTSFESQLGDGNEPDVAAQKATEVVLGKTPQQMEINNALIADWERTTVNTPSRLNSWASDFVDHSDGATVNEMGNFAIYVKDIFKRNMNYLNGDVDGATKMTKEGIDRAWGVTTINGKPEFVFQPVEKTIDLDEGANPLIKHDLYEQIQKQIAPMNEAYEEGVKNKDHRMTFFYRLKTRPSFDQYKKAESYLKNPKTGLIEPGNIKLDNRKVLNNTDRSHSTVSTATFGISDGRTVLLPTVIDGKRLSAKDAFEHFKKTGEHMGIFDSVENADKYDEKLHKDMGWLGSQNKWPQKARNTTGSPLAPLNAPIQSNEYHDAAINTVKAFKDESVKIEKVYSSGRVEAYEVAIQANPGLQQSPNGSIGSFNVALRLDNGRNSPMQGWFAGPLSEPVYMPNKKQIQDRYFQIVGLNPSGMTVRQMHEQFLQRRAQQKKLQPAMRAIFSRGHVK